MAATKCNPKSLTSGILSLTQGESGEEKLNTPEAIQTKSPRPFVHEKADDIAKTLKECQEHKATVEMLLRQHECWIYQTTEQKTVFEDLEATLTWLENTCNQLSKAEAVQRTSEFLKARYADLSISQACLREHDQMVQGLSARYSALLIIHQEEAELAQSVSFEKYQDALCKLSQLKSEFAKHIKEAEEFRQKMLDFHVECQARNKGHEIYIAETTSDASDVGEFINKAQLDFQSHKKNVTGAIEAFTKHFTEVGPAHCK